MDTAGPDTAAPPAETSRRVLRTERAVRAERQIANDAYDTEGWTALFGEAQARETRQAMLSPAYAGARLTGGA